MDGPCVTRIRSRSSEGAEHAPDALAELDGFDGVLVLLVDEGVASEPPGTSSKSHHSFLSGIHWRKARSVSADSSSSPMRHRVHPPGSSDTVAMTYDPKWEATVLT